MGYKKITTQEELEIARALSCAQDQARRLSLGSSTWGIIQYVPTKRFGQMSRFEDNSGAVFLQGENESLWGAWVDRVLAINESVEKYDESGNLIEE